MKKIENPGRGDATFYLTLRAPMVMCNGYKHNVQIIVRNN